MDCQATKSSSRCLLREYHSINMIWAVWDAAGATCSIHSCTKCLPLLGEFSSCKDVSPWKFSKEQKKERKETSVAWNLRAVQTCSRAEMLGPLNVTGLLRSLKLVPCSLLTPQHHWKTTNYEPCFPLLGATGQQVSQTVGSQFRVSLGYYLGLNKSLFLWNCQTGFRLI